MKFRQSVATCLLLVLVSCAKTPAIDYTGPVGGWPVWGGSQDGQHYTSLTQITRENVRNLHVAWIYRMGTVGDRADMATLPGRAHQMLSEGFSPEGLRYPAVEVTPITSLGRLYLCSNTNRVIALDPRSGWEIWSYDPHIELKGLHLLNCRGVTYYRDDLVDERNACHHRILTGTLDGRLIALDALTGSPCVGFGHNGTVDLAAGLGRHLPGDYSITSPPVIASNRVIVGGRIEDGFRTDMPAGVVRAFDPHTGAMLWAWNPLPPGRSDSEMIPAGEPYVRGTTNAWGVFSADSVRGLVFVPTGNTQVDLFGGNRGGLTNGLDYYSSSVVALDAVTGQVRWHFQTVHHDLWDYDVPAQPILVDFPDQRGLVPALVQLTKQGHVFVLNRETGEPLIPVVERAVPQGPAAGDYVSPTQPFPADTAYVLRRPTLTEDDMWGFTPWDRARCREAFREYRYQGVFTPPSVQGSLTYPNNLGVTNWGGGAFDPVRHLLILNTSHVASVTQLIPREQANKLIAQGEWLLPMAGTPYAARWMPFLSPLGAPCNRPPWGTLVAVDLGKGRHVWEVPLGTTRDLAPFPLWLKLGTPNLGGALVTASGLILIGATTDNYLRAFDSVTGGELWKGRLPAGPQASPMTYRLGPEEKQFVVIAAGGHKVLGTTPGDYLVAFSL